MTRWKKYKKNDKSTKTRQQENKKANGKSTKIMMCHHLYPFAVETRQILHGPGDSLSTSERSDVLQILEVQKYQNIFQNNRDVTEVQYKFLYAQGL